jgi:DNA gyrase/topoisomerase IV subunit A
MAHDSVLLLTSAGRAYCTRAWRIPEASRTSAGTALAQVCARARARARAGRASRAAPCSRLAL